MKRFSTIVRQEFQYNSQIILSFQRRSFNSSPIQFNSEESTIEESNNKESFATDTKNTQNTPIKIFNPPASPQLHAQLGHASSLHKLFFKGGIRRTTTHSKPVAPKIFTHKIKPLPQDWKPQCSHLPPTEEEYAFNLLRLIHSQDEPTIWSLWNDIKRRHLEIFFKSRTQLKNGLRFLKKNQFVTTQSGIFVRCNMVYVVNEANIREHFHAKSHLERNEKQCKTCKTVFDTHVRETDHVIDPLVWRWSKNTDELICLACKPKHEEEYASLLEKLQGNSIEVISKEQL